MEKYLFKSREEICDMLEKTAQIGITERNLEMFHMLLESLKDTYKIELYKKELEDGGYSQAIGWEAHGNYNRGGNMMPDGGNSYRRQRRDSRGRYSRDGSSSYDDGKSEMIGELEDMMHDAKSEREREAIHHCLETLRSMA